MQRRDLLAGAAALAFARAATAQPTYPAKPIRLIVPFTPGGTSDILARSIGQELTKAWGQPVVIENVPGAGGSIGSDRVAKAAPDGYTLLMGHIGTLAVTPSIYPHLPYDPVKSFAPVAWIARVPNVLAVHPSLPVHDVAEFVAYARANPGRVNYASGGNGSAAHLAMEYLKLRTHTFMVHVPYRGTSPAVTDLIAGQVQAIFTGAPAVMPFVKSGRIRALAVSSPRRMATLPQLPTVAESGGKELAGFEADQWYGIVAPAGTPAAVIARLNAQINASLEAPVLKGHLQAEGAEATPATPQVFGALIARELERWRPVVRAANVKPA